MERHQPIDAMTGLRPYGLPMGLAPRDERHAGLEVSAATARVDVERARLWRANHPGLES